MKSIYILKLNFNQIIRLEKINNYIHVAIIDDTDGSH